VDFKFENDQTITLENLQGLIIDEINYFRKINNEKELEKVVLIKSNKSKESVGLKFDIKKK